MKKKKNSPASGAAEVSFLRPNAWTALRVLVGLLLALSGFEKLIGPHQNFQFIIEQYHVVGTRLAAVVAHGLPWVELFAGAFFLLGLWTREAGLLSLLLFSIFLAVVGQAILRRLPMDECGCFGELISIPLPAVFAMDLVLAVLTFAGLRKRPGVRAFSLDAACGCA